MTVAIILLGILLCGTLLLTAGIATWQGFTVQHIKKIYLYLVSAIALVIMVIGAIMLLNMALKTWVFTKADMDYYYEPYRCAQNVPAPESKAAAPATCTAEEEARYKQEAENRRTAQKQRDAAQALAMIIVASPIWWFHWRLARKEA